MENEKSLKYFKVYSENNCWMECVSNATFRECGCNHYFMPRTENVTCGLASKNCFLRASYLVINSPLNKSSKYYCDCLPSCTSHIYTGDVSLSKIFNTGNMVKYGVDSITLVCVNDTQNKINYNFQLLYTLQE